MMIDRILQPSFLSSIFHLSLIDFSSQLLDWIRVFKDKILLEIVSCFHEDAFEVGGEPYLLVKWSQPALVQEHFDSFWTIISSMKYQ